VFDPSCKCDPERTVNLFAGFQCRPSMTASCARLLELLQYLCGEEGQDQAPVTDWVLKWIAYPLQHPGAKMRTAVVMHGSEGTGKNLFWEAVCQIYAPYSALINQHQLQDGFNDWASRKLFIVANEVVTRVELRHLAGYVKNLITEGTIPINSKFLPLRHEQNRMQLVFLSNELQPVFMQDSDRRYLVIRTPTRKSLQYYAAIEAELQADGAAALYQYLLELDLSGFNEHTKPLETEARSDLIELGRLEPVMDLYFDG
jgi:putative DNA primase/helicase